MQIQFLGTAAAPSVPVPMCGCDACRMAQRLGGRNLRRRASLLVNDDLLIDIGPDIMSSSAAFSIPLSGVSTCLQTHFHEDHFDPEMLIARHREYGTVLTGTLNLAGTEQTFRMMDAIIARRCGYGSLFDGDVQRALGIRLHVITFHRSFEIGGYRITGYPANHGAPEHGCTVYGIEDGQRRLFYGTDTSILSESVWVHFHASGAVFDLVVLDHTYGAGFLSHDGDHLAQADFIRHARRFHEEGLLRETGRIFATHLSHEGLMEHEAYDAAAGRNGYRIAYDGLSLAI